MKSASLLLLLTTLSLCACDVRYDPGAQEQAVAPVVAEAVNAEIIRPGVPIETDTAYESSTVPAYPGDHTDI